MLYLTRFMINGVSLGHSHDLSHITRQGQFICVFLKYHSNFNTYQCYDTLA